MKTIKKILISQPKPATGHNPYTELMKNHDVEIDFFQLIKIEGMDASTFRQQHINPLDYSAVIFSSTTAIDQYFHLCTELRIQVPDTMHYYCISDTVGNYLQHYIQYRKRRVFPAPNHKFEDLLPAMHRRPEEKFLMVVSDIHNDEPIKMFAENDIIVKPAVMFKTVCTPWPKNKPFDYDMIVLFTPQGVMSIKQNFPEWEQGDTIIACLGEKTAQTLTNEGFRVDIKAPSAQYPSISAAINAFLEQHNA